MRLFALSLVVALAACGGKSKPSTPSNAPVVTAPEPTSGEPTAGEPATPKPTPSDAELDALFARTLDFIDELAAGIDANVAACPKMATEIDRIFNKHQALLAEARSFEGNPEVDEKAATYIQAQGARAETASRKVKAGLDACQHDTDVQAVMKRFDEM